MTNLASLIAEHIDVDASQLGPGAKLYSIEGWDSVIALKVFMDLERETGRRLAIKSFMKAETLGEIAALAGLEMAATP